jgi:hypothetical protein
VIGQRPKFNPVGLGPFGQRFGGEGAVRDDGVAVEIGVQDGVHTGILGP